jgi:hypothetical protein
LGHQNLGLNMMCVLFMTNPEGRMSENAELLAGCAVASSNKNTNVVA